MELIRAQWPAPPGIHAVQTTRAGGVSLAPYQALNLGSNTGDSPDAVAANRHVLRQALQLPAEPSWLRQVHGVDVVEAGAAAGLSPCADAVCSARAGEVCAVLTADCLPVLFCSLDGDWLAAAHAGWRGLAAGVLEATLARAPRSARLIAWLGAALGPDHFEVGPEVRQSFVQACAEDAAAFRPGQGDRWMADLYALARGRLRRAGVQGIYGGGLCTYADPARFFSFRRACHEGAGETGRMASLIWRTLPD